MIAANMLCVLEFGGKDAWLNIKKYWNKLLPYLMKCKKEYFTNQEKVQIGIAESKKQPKKGKKKSKKKKKKSKKGKKKGIKKSAEKGTLVISRNDDGVTYFRE